LKRLLSLFLLALAAFLFSTATPLFAGDAVKGAPIFSANCAACHAGGGNLVAGSGKSLKKAALETNGMYSAEAIIAQVTNGKKAMPSFKGRLMANQIDDVATYVLSQAEKDWK
jgi:cytochrome c6